MKFGYELAAAMLWLIAAIATMLAVEGTGVFTYTAPVYFVCMVGTVLIVRASRGKA